MNILLIIALVVAGGVSFSADKSLPGETLYPIKVGVNERVRGALAVSAESEAELQSRLALRRLIEAEKLAIDGRLNAAAEATVESRLSSHAEKVATFVKDMSDSEDVSAALDISSAFEGALLAHEKVLSRMRGEAGVSVDALAEIEARVAAHRDAIAKLRAQAEARMMAEENAQAEVKADVLTRAEGKRKAAENKITGVRRFIEAKKERLEADAKAEVEARVDVAEGMIARANVNMEAGSYGEAFILFQQALRTAEEAKLVVVTESELKLNLIQSLVVNRKIETETEANTNVELRSEESGSGRAEGPDTVEAEGESETEINGAGEKVEAKGSLDLKLKVR